MTIFLSLTTPIDNTEQYDKDIRMFEMEVEDIVELTTSEFNEYIHDDNPVTRNAKFSNMAYSEKFR